MNILIDPDELRLMFKLLLGFKLYVILSLIDLCVNFALNLDTCFLLYVHLCLIL